MRDGEPGWFYVGSGQLRYKDMDGWTDQFQDLDGPAKGPAVGPDESPDVAGPITEQGIRGRRRHKPLPFITFCAAAARGLIGVPIRLMGALWALIAMGYGRESANLSSRHRATNRHSSQSASSSPADGLPAFVQKPEGDQPSVHTIRRIGAAVLIVAAFGVWFGMKPASANTATSYRAAVTAALATDASNNTPAVGAARQAVVNGRTARDLLTIIANEAASAQPLPADERPAALLTLLAIGLGLGLATSLRAAAREPAMNSPLIPEPLTVMPAAAPVSQLRVNGDLAQCELGAEVTS